MLLKRAFLRTRLNVPELKQILERLVWRYLNSLLLEGTSVTERSPRSLATDISSIERLIAVGHRLSLGLCLDRSQELYFDSLHSQIVPLCLGWLQQQAGSMTNGAIDLAEHHRDR